MLIQDNLKVAYAYESHVNQMFAAFSERDRKRWGGKLGRLFQAVVKAEIIYAQKHLQGLPAVGSTLENTKEATPGEYGMEGLYLDYTA